MEGQIPEELQGQEEADCPAQGRIRAKRLWLVAVACGGVECASLQGQFHIAPREL